MAAEGAGVAVAEEEVEEVVEEAAAVAGLELIFQLAEAE